MVKLTFDEYVFLSALVNADMNSISIMNYAESIGYDLPLADLYATATFFLNSDLVYVKNSVITTSPFNNHSPLTLTDLGISVLQQQDKVYGLLVKRVHKRVREGLKDSENG